MMRKALTIAAMTIFVLGFFWQFGRWLLRWSGYGLGLRTRPDSYHDVVESLADKIAGEASVGWIAGPWLLMSLGLMTLIILRARTTAVNVHSK